MRNPETGMSRHYQFETTLINTGRAADVRGAIQAVRARRCNGLCFTMRLPNGVVSRSWLACMLRNDDNNVALKSQSSEIFGNKRASQSLYVDQTTLISDVVNGSIKCLATMGQQ